MAEQGNREREKSKPRIIWFDGFSEVLGVQKVLGKMYTAKKLCMDFKNIFALK